MEMLTLGIRFPVSVGDDEVYRKVVNAIREYREALRRGAALWFLGQSLASEPKIDKKGWLQFGLTDDLNSVLGLFTGGNPGKAHAYALREFFKSRYPHWKSWLHDNARMEVSTKVRAKDAKLTKCRRDWLVMNFERQPPMFQFVGIPVKHDEGSRRDCEFVREGKKIRLRWDREISWVEFALNGKLDPGQYHVWNKVLSGDWKPASPRISERDGRLFVSFAYKRPPKDLKLNPKRVLEVDFAKGKCDDGVVAYCAVAGEKRRGRGLPLDDVRRYLVRGNEAIAYLRRQAVQQDALRERRRHAVIVGRAKVWVQKRRDQVTANRTAVCADWNRAWAKAIAEYARRWDCGIVRVFDFPENLMGLSWPLAELRRAIQIKADLYRFKVEYTENPEV